MKTEPQGTRGANSGKSVVDPQDADLSRRNLLLAGSSLATLSAFGMAVSTEPVRAQQPPPPRTVTFDENDDLDVPDFLK